MKENLIKYIAERGRRIGAYFLERSVPPIKNPVKLGRGYLILAGLSGLLLALAYPGWDFGSTWLTTSDLGWLAWLGFVPLLFALDQITGDYEIKRPRLRSFKLAFFAGLVYFLIIFRWFWSIYPLNSLGIESNLLSFLIVLLIYLVSSIGMAAFWGIFGWAYSLWPIAYSKKVFRFANGKWLFVPLLFVLLGYLQSWGFGLLWLGSGTLLGPHWTQGNLAYALVNNQFVLKLASAGGIYAVTFLIVFVNGLLLWILTAEKRKTATKIIFAGLIMLSLVLANFYKPFTPKQNSEKTINFAIAQTAQPTRISLSPQEALAGLKEELGLLNRIAKEYPESQVIAFPEASDLFKNISLFLTPAQIQKYFTGLFKEPRLIIAGGKTMGEDGKGYSRAFSLDTQQDIISYYDKRLLVPSGEFLPYPLKLLVFAYYKITNSNFADAQELAVGKVKVSTVDFRGQFKAAPLVCSELLSPGLTRQVSQDSDFIISMASYGFFHGNRTIFRQMQAATRFRAVEIGKPILTAANLGPSYVVDNQGNITYSTQNGDPQILTGSIAIGNGNTWYNKVGDLPIFLVFLLLILLIFSFQFISSRI